MTSNQVAYQKNLEEARHNLAMESLTSQQLAETKRHNVAQDEIQRYNAEINRTLGMQRNYLTGQQIQASERASLRSYEVQSMSNKLRQDELGEQMRHNYMTEYLTEYAADRNFAIQSASTAGGVMNAIVQGAASLAKYII